MNHADRKFFAALSFFVAVCFLPFLFEKAFAQFPLSANEKTVLWGASLVCAFFSLWIGFRGVPKKATLFSIFLVLAGLELATRITVNRIVPEWKKPTLVRGLISHPNVWRYQGHPFLHFTGNPNFLFEKDWVGTEGFYPKKIKKKKNGEIRVACLGASTSKLYPNVLQSILQLPYEVMNFALDGYSTVHSVVNTALNVIDHDIDYLVFHHGPTGMPSGANGDYRTIYRPFTPNLPIDASLIRLSVLYREIRHRITPIQGWYGHQFSVIHNVDEFLALPELEPYERNLKTIVDIALGRGIHPVLTTHPYRRSGEKGTQLLVEANRAVRKLALSYGNRVTLVDMEQQITDSSLFADLFHMGQKEGTQKKASLIAEAILAHRNKNQPRSIPLS